MGEGPAFLYLISVKLYIDRAAMHGELLGPTYPGLQRHVQACRS